MISQLKILLRLKEMKHDKALREMQAKRQELDAAISERLAAKAKVDESLATYSRREDAIYAEVIGQVIEMDAVDIAHGRVVQLEKAHAKLNDAFERALHVEARLEQELQAAIEAYRVALRSRDKFVLLEHEAREAEALLAEQKEEVEVEDLFARPRPRAA